MYRFIGDVYPKKLKRRDICERINIQIVMVRKTMKLYLEERTFVYLPKCSRSAKAIAENMPTMITSSGLNIAAKTGPFLLIHHVWR